MAYRILVALKPGDTHTNATERVREIASVIDVEVMLYCALFDSTIESTHFIDSTEKESIEAGMISAEHSRLSGIAEQLKSVAKSISIEVEWCKKISSGISQATARFSADILIVSAMHRSSFIHSIFSEQINDTAPIPVLIASDQSCWQYKTIIAAVDPTNENDADNSLDRKVISESRKVANLFGSELYLAHAYLSEQSIISSDYVPSKTQLDKWKQTSIDAMNRFALAVEADNESIQLSGNFPHIAIENIAKDKNANLIIIGTHSRSVLRNYIFGSTVERILHSTPIDVLVCRN